jgi:E3 ubiquitin-protein ligase TRIP12
MPYLLLQLLRLLEGASRLLGVPVGAGEFLNAQVSGKLARQLQDPLALVSRSLPDWCPQVMREAPFLLPFELRRLYLLASSVGVARSLALLQATLQAEQGAAAPQIMLVTRGEGGRESVAPPRVPKRKVRISRERILESAQRVLELESPTQARNAVLEVEYFGEVGTGLGPTLEFFTLVSRDLQRRGLGLWYGDVPLTAAAAAAAPSPAPASASEEPDAYLQAGSGAGLFPLAYRDPPAQVLERFRFLGRFVGKALLDQRTLDLRFSPAFLRRAVHGEALTPLDLRDVSPELARQFDELRALVRRRDELLARGELEAASALGLREGSRVVDLGLDFSVPGHPGWEMQPGAPLVTIDNLHEYLDEACEHLLGRGIQRQVEAFRAGLAAVLPVPGLLRGFSLEELELLLNGDPMVESAAQWTPEALQEVIQADHGYSLASRTLRSLLEVLGEMSPHERRLFLQFVTGSPRLPLGGLRALQPRLTVVRKEHVPPLTPDHYLPSVMTCANYLKLPDYSSKEILRTRLMTAVHEGLSSFHLS